MHFALHLKIATLLTPENLNFYSITLKTIEPSWWR